jgi:O-acetyl-ADP-ribose deacetylase (regulator of RNase III)
MNEISINVVLGDISKVKTDALITAINSRGIWFGHIDAVIIRNAGDLFHSQIESVMPLKDGQTIVTRSGRDTHNGTIANVVFVVDDQKHPLREVIRNGLQAASDAGFESVSLPTIRMGKAINIVEKSVEEVMAETAAGVKDFLIANPETLIKKIIFVVHSNQNTQALLQKALRQ